ncbi:hypothetical protein SAMN02745248_01588 [Hathewaya proteolytica DSM 3090]|uniref:Probable membrane transporter protein n=1 Tax=Hathewaya proteolytica DSM 3090 TaxID=1121331 RepID=A0A1M6P4S7_9CLOT|nr:TSUP family transporter [Hathewaya proteolytica]SHK02944.1 hypothetical protein SAMN02745248_01588 [Hathewaya proteolytica DSM 3090]
MTIFLLCVVGFIAAFVDSIAGGGGILSLPAFLMTGIPAHKALGTNKFCATSGSLTSSLKFIKERKVDFSILKYLIPFTFMGAALGVTAVSYIPSDFLKPLILILIIFIGVYTIFSKNLGQINKNLELTKKRITIGILFAFIIGFYDGFFGPGTGSFLVFGLIKIFGEDFTIATGNAKVLNFVSNVCSFILFAIKGQILYTYAIPVAIFMMMGAHLGSKLAIKNGAKFIKPIFVTMSMAVAIKLVYPFIENIFK